MSQIDPGLIPGYAEAVAQEQSNRNLAFLGYPLPLCGMTIRQMTPRHVILLQECGNRFFAGGWPTFEDVGMFLWFLSPHYQPGEEHAKAFYRNIAKRAREENAMIEEITAYLVKVFQDAPASSGIQGKQYTASAAALVDVLAREYGWSDEEVLDKPLGRLYQYFREIQYRHNPKAPRFNRSDSYISAWLRHRMAGVN